MDASTFRTLRDAAGVTLLVWAGAMALALVLGLFVAVGRLSSRRLLRWPAAVFVEVVRGIPLVVLIVWFHFVLFTGVLSLESAASAILALAVCYAAFMGETYRAGIEAVDPGQMEAARALGLDRSEAMRWVILPQAIRNVLPALGNESIALLKDTSLASVIAVPELLKRSQEIAGREFNYLPVLTLVAGVYLAMTLALTRVQRRLERRFGGGTPHTAPAHH